MGLLGDIAAIGPRPLTTAQKRAIASILAAEPPRRFFALGFPWSAVRGSRSWRG